MNKKHSTTPLIGLLFFVCLWAQAVHGTDLTLSLGNLCEYVGKVQTDANAGTNVCSFNPYLASSLDFPVNRALIVSPQVGFSFPQSGNDENIQRMTMLALINSKFKSSWINFIGGMGLFFTRIWGPGGEAELNNGTSTDSFPLPAEAVYARNFILNLGMELEMGTEWSAEVRSYIFNLTSSEDRAVSVGFHATYHFGEVL